jgi:uncharacterized protein (TIGR04255 family)
MSDHRFQPIYQAHAIVEMVVFFELAYGLEGHMAHLLSIRSDMAQDFPSSDILQSIEISFPQNQDPKNGGIELRRYKPDGTPEWLIRIISRTISIHCLEYTRWQDVWPKINQYISTIFARLSETGLQLSAVGLKYIDQFIFEGDIKDYDLSHLFKKDTSLLNSRAFSSGAHWHCHCGWFQEMPGLGKVLSQMNTTGIAQDEQHGVIVIDHTFTLHAQTQDVPLATCLLPDLAGEDARSNIVKEMHRANKCLLGELLVDSMQQRISLCPGDTL